MIAQLFRYMTKAEEGLSKGALEDLVDEGKSKASIAATVQNRILREKELASICCIEITPTGVAFTRLYTDCPQRLTFGTAFCPRPSFFGP